MQKGGEGKFLGENTLGRFLLAVIRALKSKN